MRGSTTVYIRSLTICVTSPIKVKTYSVPNMIG
jgi:hypothetical protein